MKYAVIQTGGKQYKVAEGDVIEVEHLVGASETITFDNVLMVAQDEKAQIGMPYVDGVSVMATVVEPELKGEKIRVAKFKAKARYRRVNGHRQLLSRIKIESIGSQKVSKVGKVSEVPKEEAEVAKPKRTTKKA